jgi:prophage regulatory protein
MARELPDRIDSSSRIPATGSSPGKSVATGDASRRSQPRGANNGSSVGDAPPTRLLRFPVVRERTGLSRSTIWRLERRGEFPRHRRISANAIAWVEAEIAEWIRERTG